MLQNCTVYERLNVFCAICFDFLLYFHDPETLDCDHWRFNYNTFSIFLILFSNETFKTNKKNNEGLANFMYKNIYI